LISGGLSFCRSKIKGDVSGIYKYARTNESTRRNKKKIARQHRRLSYARKLVTA